jgi:phosphatidylserine/phosphatidylglycerophosphate/cardiolipin synthase-like enzyme
MATPPDFEVFGANAKALFSLKVFRGEGMALLGMNWLNGTPPYNFVGFAIEYQEPGGAQYYALSNRLSFLENDGSVNAATLSSKLSPIQKFRWVHFPFHADLPGLYSYRVTPVFMDGTGVLSYGEIQEAAIQLRAETYPDELNIAFTRGFISSQAFIDHFSTNGDISNLLPGPKDDGLNFTATAADAPAALDWMGFEAREAILSLLKAAVADTTAQVRVTAYDLNEPEVVEQLVLLGGRLKIIIDDSGSHGGAGTPETEAAAKLSASAGAANVQRQHMGGLQHNKTIAVSGSVEKAIGGSTNFSWRGFFVQNNNAVVLSGATAVKLFFDDFDNLWKNANNAGDFAKTGSATWNDLGLPNVKAKIAFSPHSTTNAALKGIADDIETTTSSLLFSLAFLYQTEGVIKDAIVNITNTPGMFVYGISDKKVGGLDIKSSANNLPSVFPANLLQNVPEPFKTEASGGAGVRMHHKFVVIDFDKPSAKVYMGSYNFSTAADRNNGENLMLFEDRRIAVSYMIEAVAMFDHYEFRDAMQKANVAGDKLYLAKPPVTPADVTWWHEDFTDPQKISDRELFSKPALP